jgi:hypothetical protein
LAVVRVEVERGRIRHIAPCVIGNDCDVIADLALVWIAFERIKRIAYLNVGRPSHAAVRAPRIK